MESKDHERDAVITVVSEMPLNMPLYYLDNILGLFPTSLVLWSHDHTVILWGDEGEYKEKNKFHSENGVEYFDSRSPPSRSTSLPVLQVQHVLLSHHEKGW